MYQCLRCGQIIPAYEIVARPTAFIIGIRCGPVIEVRDELTYDERMNASAVFDKLQQGNARNMHWRQLTERSDPGAYIWASS